MIHSCLIDIPPSANDLWQIIVPKGPPKKGKRRKRRAFMAKTTVYKQWLETASFELSLGLPAVAIYPAIVRIVIRAGSGFPRSRDCDNVIKGAIDALRMARIVKNDRVTEIRLASAEYIESDNQGPATCTVEIEAARFAEKRTEGIVVKKVKLPSLFE